MSRRPIPLLLAATLLGACATPDRFVLLPAADGRPGALLVSGPGGEAVLAEPYAEAIVGKGDTRVGKTDAASVAARYGRTLAAVPARPESFVLYFEAGADVLAGESAARLPQIREAVARRAAAEVVVTGHTDRVGKLEGNDALSLRRAQTVRDQLVAAGIDAERITTAGRGEREPLVPTEDEVAEARNRRVEVKVR